MVKTYPFLAGCATTAVLIASVFVLCGAKSSGQASFDEITVQRINIIEPDGTKRVIISNRARFPGAFEKGAEIKRPDRADVAGLLFVNDEGTENGGLIQNGKLGADGKVSAGMSLTFDRFRQDQALQLLHTDDPHTSNTAIRINDVPSHEVTSMAQMRAFGTEAQTLPAAERKAYWRQLDADGRLTQNRIFMGTTRDKASVLTLSDAAGKPRMRLMVTAKGEPLIEMLDDKGQAVKTVRATD